MSYRGHLITHLAYADDIVIFTSGNKKSVKLIMKQITEYEDSSGQKVNKEKTYFVTNPKAWAQRIIRMRECTNFLDKSFPVNYLGLYIGRKKLEYFDGMITKMTKRLNGGRRKMSCYGGRVVLIKSVLQSLPLYTWSAMSPPKGTLNYRKSIYPYFSGNLLVIRTSSTGVHR